MCGTQEPMGPGFRVEPTGTHFGPICLEPGTHIFEIRVPTPDLKEKSYHV